MSIANLEAAAHGLETTPAIERNKVSGLASLPYEESELNDGDHARLETRFGLDVVSFQAGKWSQFVGERYELLVRGDLKLFG